MADPSEAHSRSVPNDAPSLKSVPPELFVQVLGDVYRLVRKGIPPWDRDWTVPYQLVCRRWRDVIYSTPRLWQEIFIWRNTKWLEFSLTRCAGTRASVHVLLPVWPEETYATLRRHAQSIGQCYIYSSTASLEECLPSWLTTPMPAVTTLSIKGVAGQDPAYIPMTHDLFPRLIHLTLCNCKPPRDTSIYTSLCSLSLTSCQLVISYSEFLSLLGQCHTLESLTLDETMLDWLCIDGAMDLSTDYRSPTMPLVLPRLRYLALTEEPKSLFRLLAIIHAPQALTVKLTTCSRFGVRPSDLKVTHILAPNPQQRLRFLSFPRTVSLSCWGKAPFMLSLQCGRRRTALFSLEYHTRSDKLRERSMSVDLEPRLAAAMDVFAVGVVDTLEVEGRLDTISVETWQRVFQTFSRLRTLTLKGQGTLDAVWAGLARATASSLEREGTLCCPRLSRVATECPKDAPFKFVATPTLFEAVREALAARVDAGGTRLRRLKLYLDCPLEVWTEAYRDGNAALEEMEELVHRPTVFLDQRTDSE